MKTSLKAAMRKRPSGRRSWKIKLPPLKRAVCSDDKFLSELAGERNVPRRGWGHRRFCCARC